jgi:hypothetical protein
MLTRMVKGCARHGVRERAGARRDVREAHLRPAGAKPLARASGQPCATAFAQRRLSDDPKSARLSDKTRHAASMRASPDQSIAEKRKFASRTQLRAQPRARHHDF